jgi:hypothetical protein
MRCRSTSESFHLHSHGPDVAGIASPHSKKLLRRCRRTEGTKCYRSTSGSFRSRSHGPDVVGIASPYSTENSRSRAGNEWTTRCRSTSGSFRQIPRPRRCWHRFPILQRESARCRKTEGTMRCRSIFRIVPLVSHDPDVVGIASPHSIEMSLPCCRKTEGTTALPFHFRIVPADPTAQTLLASLPQTLP